MQVKLSGVTVSRRIACSRPRGAFLLGTLVLLFWVCTFASAAADQASTTDHHKRQTRSRSASDRLDEQVKKFTTRLELNENQESQVRTILKSRQEQLSHILRSSSPSRMDAVTQLRAINESTVARIRAILNDEQKKKYDPLNHSTPSNSEPQPSVDDWLQAMRSKPAN